MKFSSKFHKLLSVLLAVALVLGVSGTPAQLTWAAETLTTSTVSVADDVDSGDIVILYDNDTHCAVDGYAKVAAIRDEMETKTSYVTLVSAGDFIQGDTIGALSKGKDPVDIMNEAGYDIVTLGNHEFDFTVKQLEKLEGQLQAKVVSCNYMDLETNKAVYASYTTKKYGDKKIAFVGITTPEAITKSTPTYFQDADGNYIYGFSNDTTGKALYKRVQKAVDRARKYGADYVVALAHLGIDETTEARWTSTNVIKNTTGIDVMLDGHSHSTFASNTIKNKDGKDVIVSQTGSRFENIGKLVIAKDGTISTSLIPTSDYTEVNEDVAELIAEIKADYEAEVSKVIGTSTVELTTMNPDTGKRAVRSEETNLGDFCADAIRTVLGGDIALMNGGGIRADIKTGDITYNNLLTVFPWSNMGCLMEVTGQQIKDALEHGARNYPEENGGFLQVSGLKYTIDTTIPTSVKTDENAMFLSVDGAYRVKNIQVLNEETGKYEKLDLKKNYKVAGINYTLKSAGDGFSMFKGSPILKDEVVVDNEILIKYLMENLNGTVGSDYKNPKGEGRITIK